MTDEQRQKIAAETAAGPCLKIDTAARVNFASAQNSVAILKSIEISNPADADIDDLELELVADPVFLRSKTWTLDRIGRQEAVNVRDRTLGLDHRFLAGLNEAEHGRLVFRLSRQGRTLVETECPIELLARDEWGGLDDMDLLLAAFVAPNDPAVAKILKEAGRILERAGHSPALDGYQSRDPRRAYMLAAAA